jgi:hypothetical protein
MNRVVAVVGVALALSGCAALGRYPGQTDAACVRTQMAAPQYLTVTAAFSRCGRFADNGTDATLIPINLAGDPALQVQARAAGLEYSAGP